MYRFTYSIGILLASFLLSHARHTFFIPHSGEKPYLPSSSNAEVCMTPTCVIAAADVLTSLDETVDPCDDFYGFACGGWMKKHEVSEEQPLITVFRQARNYVNKKLRDLLESEYKSSEPDFVKMMKDFYKICVDLDTIEKEGSEPLEKMLRHLGGWPVVEGNQWDESTFDWVDTLISFRKLGYGHEVMLSLFVINEHGLNETFHRLYLDDSYMGDLENANLSLGLDDPKTAAYYRMMVTSAKLLGADESTSEKELLEALHFELDIIKIQKEIREAEEKRYPKMITIAELQKELPQVPWLKFINGLLLIDQVDDSEKFINANPDFLVKLVELITSTEKRVIANYMLGRAVLESTEYLSEEWRNIKKDEEDEESSKKCKSKEEPRWTKCLTKVELYMELGLSSYYVRHYLSDESKDEARMLMKYVHKEFLKILENNDWMDEKTRNKAEEKANAMKAYIGYPKELLNDTLMLQVIGDLTITADSYLENILAFKREIMDQRFLELRNGRNEVRNMLFYWEFQNLIGVNGLYSLFQNSISIPAGILQHPFYDKNRPTYMNFGTIGYVIGHEITHGFDNIGRRFDKDGKQVNWWDEESDKHFRKKVKCIIDQYDNYTTDIGLKVNGEKTQNENIADNVGLKEAYLAYQSWTKEHGTEPLLPGVSYNQNQLFWLSAASLMCSEYHPETLKEFLITDKHSPGKFRIIGPMSNLAEFSKDFKCSPDAPMNRKYKCEVW